MAPKQIFVLDVTVRSERDRTKAMEIVGGTAGVTSLQCEEAQGKITVKGEGVDIYELAHTLTKKVGRTDISELHTTILKSNSKC